MPRRPAEIDAGPLGGSPSYVRLPPPLASRPPTSRVVRMAINRTDHGAKSAPKAPTISALVLPTPNQWSLHANALTLE